MNLLFSCVGKRGGYIADYFRTHLGPTDRIIGTANTPWTPGFKACDAAFVLPDVDDEAYAPAVIELCEREQIDAVLPMEDFDLPHLARARSALLDLGVVPLFPTADVIERALDKYRMFEFLTSKGIATPRTARALQDSSDFAYPMYVKPRWGSGSKHLFRARNASELAVFFDYAPDMIIQEEARGQELNIQLCNDLEGRPIGISVLEKRSMRHGETDQAETIRDPAIIEFGLRLGELLGGTGPVDIDLIRCGDDLVVLEVNTRFGGGYPVSHLAGADFPRLLLELVRHGTVTEPSLGFTGGVVMMKDFAILGGSRDSFFRDELHIEDS